MRVWVMQGMYDGELFSSVHLTEKGCALACIDDLMQFLGIEDEETALEVMHASYSYTSEEKKVTEATEPFEWDMEKMKDMTREQLWKIFSEWSEVSWDRMSDRMYSIDANMTMVVG